MNKKDFETKSLNELCAQLSDEGQNITSYETLKDCAIENIENDNFFMAQHICEALNDYQTDYYLYDYNMGTLETPTPIKSKEDISDLIEEEE